MNLSRTLVAISAVLSLSLGIAACSHGVGEEAETQDEAFTQAEVPVGIASAPVFGTFEGAGVTFEVGGRQVQQPGSYSAGGFTFTGIGTELKTIANHSSGFAGTWKCQDAQKLVGAAITAGATQDCWIELNTTGTSPTGASGVAFVMFGLDPSGKGLSSYRRTGGAPAPVNGGAVHRVSAGPPRSVNVTIDHDTVLEAMLKLHARFASGPVGDRNVCLKNARAAQWLDIQAHYYCLLPLDSVRRCFSGKIIELSQSSDASVAATAVPRAYEACFKSASHPDAAWVHANQEAVFKYVMFTKQGVFDFELGSENKTISDFYQRIGSERARRVLDTYPAWLPEQPRYDEIRKLQIKAQQVPAADGGS